MTFQLRTAVVTGGSSGIGFATAQALVARGDKVVIGGRDGDKLAQAARTLGSAEQVRFVAGDSADPATATALVSAAVEAFGSIDILVNNAGTFGMTPITDVEPAELDQLLNGNLRGTYLVTQAVARQLIAQNTGGAIVNITTALLSHALGSLPASATLISKGGVRALTIALAAELAPYRIRVNEVAPGIVRTPLHAGGDVDALSGLAALNRVAEPHEIASAVIHLADADFTTGAILTVDGGFATTRA
ncbi:SDR family NAD(P)-dependent oxidoreductase [Nocardia australiensis]|uniref:SDR family NAD(P)-dependent oxidoreductase n=1 Tax=Nocardia australiensis TaxID=2887191 RepID=UPI001D150F86|nr:SDR family oxidoreductase [Nocardia australiensis]